MEKCFVLHSFSQDWQNIQFIHIFQDQLVTGQRSSSRDIGGQPSSMEPVVDLQTLTVFEENFFLVVIEKMSNGASVLHMWRIVISSHGNYVIARRWRIVTSLHGNYVIVRQIHIILGWCLYAWN